MVEQGVLLNKPTYVGMSILDLNKSTIYYNHIKSIYDTCDVVLISDINSLVYSIETDDL